MKKNGFTLIEALAVIIILGIIMTIAIPAVSKYILQSDKSAYASDVIAYLETARGEYEMKDYGSYLKSNEIMIVPLKNIELEKGSSKESPFGKIDLDRSYILIVPEKKGYEFYATVVDDTGTGFIEKKQNELNKSVIQNDIKDEIEPLATYLDSSKVFKFTINDNNYEYSDIRNIDTYERQNLDADIIILKIVAQP